MKARSLLFGLMLAIAAPAFATGKEVRVHVNGMVCSFCSQGITKNLTGQAEVESVKVSMEDKLVRVSLKEGKDLSDAKITELIQDAGMSVEKIER